MKKEEMIVKRYGMFKGLAMRFKMNKQIKSRVLILTKFSKTKIPKGYENMTILAPKTNEKLNVVGDGNLLNYLKQKYKDSKNIVFHGWKNQMEVTEFLSQSRAIFVPSIWYEGAPLVIFESLSIGLPIAVSNICSGKNFVTNDTGRVFNPYDSDDFNKILSDFNNDLIIKRISIKSFDNYWKNPYDDNRYYLSLIDLYKHLGEK